MILTHFITEPEAQNFSFSKNFKISPDRANYAKIKIEDMSLANEHWLLTLSLLKRCAISYYSSNAKILIPKYKGLLQKKRP